MNDFLNSKVSARIQSGKQLSNFSRDGRFSTGSGGWHKLWKSSVGRSASLPSMSEPEGWKLVVLRTHWEATVKSQKVSFSSSNNGFSSRCYKSVPGQKLTHNHMSMATQKGEASLQQCRMTVS